MLSFVELIAACLRGTYGKTRKDYTWSDKAKALQDVAHNLSGGPTPDSRILLAEMKSRKQHGEII